jgi:hypothetical protein
MKKHLLSLAFAAATAFLCLQPVSAQSNDLIYGVPGNLRTPFLEEMKTASNPNPVVRVAATLTETEPNNTPAQANSLNIGDSINATINPAAGKKYPLPLKPG